MLHSPISALVAHWLFQGMLYMGTTERRFKLALDALLTVLMAAPLRLRLPREGAWLVAFVQAHTLNFLFNGHLWGALKHYGVVRQGKPEFEAYTCRLSTRIREEPSIRWAGLYGSQVRGEWSATSDLDVRLVRKPGAANAIRASAFALAERSRALVHGFPLDLYVLDHLGQLAVLGCDEPPQVIKGLGYSVQAGVMDHE